MTLKGNLRREIKYLLIATQNNVIRTNYVKVKIKMQQNSKCRLCSDRDQTFNCIISECSKFVQKEYKIRFNWTRKVIHWELCKKFQFDLATKRYMHNSESVLENETYKLLWNLKIQTDHLRSARRPDLVIVKFFLNSWIRKKENLSSCRLRRPSRPQSENKRKRKERKILAPTKNYPPNPPQKNTMDYEGDCDTNSKWHAPSNPQMLGKETGRLRNKRTSRDHPNYNISSLIGCPFHMALCYI